MHTELLWPPTVAEEVPEGQAVCTELPWPHQYPAWQVWQVEEADCFVRPLYVPAGHGVEDAEPRGQ